MKRLRPCPAVRPTRPVCCRHHSADLIAAVKRADAHVAAYLAAASPSRAAAALRAHDGALCTDDGSPPPARALAALSLGVFVVDAAAALRTSRLRRAARALPVDSRLVSESQTAN